MTAKQGISQLARFLVGAVLIYSGFSKAVASLPEFAAVIDAYKLVPGSWATPLAQMIPWIELYTGTFLIFGYQTHWAARTATGLFTLFLGALGSTLVRGIDLASCGCFGAGINLPPRITFVLDFFLLSSSLWIVFRPPQKLCLDPVPPPNSTGPKGSFSV